MDNARAVSGSRTKLGRLVIAVLATLGILAGTFAGTPMPASAASYGVISGRIVGGTSEVPVAGVSVSLATRERDGTSQSVTTNSDGVYIFPTVATFSGGYDLYVGNSPDRRYVYLGSPLGPVNSYPGDPQTFNFRLTEAGRIQGTVVTPEGAPAAGASVIINGGNDYWQRTPVTVAADGSFASGWLVPGSATVRAELAGSKPSATTTVTVAPGSTTTGLTLALRAPVSVSGTVTSPSGEPVGSVSVLLGWGRSAETGADGRYTFSDVAEGSFTLQFEDRRGRYATQWWRNAATPAGAAQVVVSYDRPSITGVDAQLSLLPSASIGGFAYDPEHKPLPGIPLKAVGPSGERYASTDYRGAYRFANLQPGTYTITYAGGTRAEFVGYSTQVEVIDAPAPLDIVLQRKGVVKVSVNADLPQGITSTAASVRLENVDTNTDVRVPPTLTSAYTDVTFRLVAPGRYRVHLVPLSQTWLFTEEWWDDAHDIADAKIITVEAGTETSVEMTLDQIGVLTTATPTITGSLTAGSTLSADAGSWSPTTTKLAYQWIRNGTAIAGATNRTYVIGDTDLGSRISVRVTGSLPGYKTAVRTSGTVSPPRVLSQASVPTIRGEAIVGRPLTVTAGTWGPAPVTLTYQWRRSGVAIAGATGTSYTLADADAGRTVTVTVTGKKDGFSSAQRTSVKTGPILRTFGLVAAPKVNGSPVVGSPITASGGSWTTTPSRLTYQWLRSGQPIPGATSDRYTPVAADAGKTLAIRVTLSSVGYVTRTYDRAAAAPVMQRFSSAPTPAILGTPKVGNTVAVMTGSWGPAPVPLTFQWKRDGANIAGAQGTSYRLTTADAGKRITVQVTGVKAGFTTESRTSPATAFVSAG